MFPEICPGSRPHVLTDVFPIVRIVPCVQAGRPENIPHARCEGFEISVRHGSADDDSSFRVETRIRNARCVHMIIKGIEPPLIVVRQTVPQGLRVRCIGIIALQI